MSAWKNGDKSEFSTNEWYLTELFYVHAILYDQNTIYFQLSFFHLYSSPLTEGCKDVIMIIRYQSPYNFTILHFFTLTIQVHPV